MNFCFHPLETLIPSIKEERRGWVETEPGIKEQYATMENGGRDGEEEGNFDGGKKVEMCSMEGRRWRREKKKDFGLKRILILFKLNEINYVEIKKK